MIPLDPTLWRCAEEALRQLVGLGALCLRRRPPTTSGGRDEGLPDGLEGLRRLQRRAATGEGGDAAGLDQAGMRLGDEAHRGGHGDVGMAWFGSAQEGGGYPRRRCLQRRDRLAKLPLPPIDEQR